MSVLKARFNSAINLLTISFLTQVTKTFDFSQPLTKTPVFWAIAALVLALFFISSSAIFIRLSEQEITFGATAFSRFWITAIVLGAWQGFLGLRYRLNLEQPKPALPQSGWVWAGLLALAIFFSADLVLYAWSLTQTSVANATLLSNLTPLFTTLGAWLLLGRRFDNQFLIGMLIAITGAVALGLEDITSVTSQVTGDIAAFAAAITFSGYLLVLEQLQTRLDPTLIIFWSSAIATLFTLPFVLLTGGRIFPYSWQGWLTIIALSLFCQVFGQRLLVYSLNHLSSGFVALFLLLEPVFAAIGAGTLLSEKLAMLSWVSFAVVLLGMYLALSSQSTWE